MATEEEEDVDGAREYDDYEIEAQQAEEAGEAQAEWDELGNEQSGGASGSTRGIQNSSSDEATGITARYLMSDLPPSITEDDLKGYFSGLGEIKEVTIRLLSTGQIMGSVKFAYPTYGIRQTMLNDQHWIRGTVITVQTWKMQKLARPGYAKWYNKYTSKGDSGKDAKDCKGPGKSGSYGGYGFGYALPFFGKGYKGDMAYYGYGGKTNKEGPYGCDWRANPFFGLGMGYKGCKDTYGKAGYGKQSKGYDWCWPDFGSYDGASTWGPYDGGQSEPYHDSGAPETSPAKGYLRPKEKEWWEEKDITARYLLADLAEHITEEDLQTYFSVFGEIEDITLRRLESSGKVIGSVKFFNPTLELRNLMLREVHEVQGCPVRVQTWKMQKMQKPGFKFKKEIERAPYHTKWDGWAGADSSDTWI